VTKVLPVDPANPDAAAIARAAECLRAGGLVAFPTETVYGLGAHALDRRAVRRLFAAKGRPANDPLIVHVAAVDDVTPLVAEFPAIARELAERFWPGPLTMVLPKAKHVPEEVTAGLDTVAVRIPSHAVARALLEYAHLPIAAPSANRFAHPSPTRAAHVLADLDGHIDIVLDGGPTTVGLESTVVDLTHSPPRVLRPGAIHLAALKEVMSGVTSGSAMIGRAAAAMPSPGMLGRHYSPATPLLLFEGERAAALAQLIRAARCEVDRGRTVGVLAFAGDHDELRTASVRVIELGDEDDPPRVATRLYAALREGDELGVDVLLARNITSDHPLSTAIQDRLRRAATSPAAVALPPDDLA
jgi:L-threonylcarbamoyladenylate synthase